MNAVIQNDGAASTSCAARARLCPEFAQLSPEALLAHLRTACRDRWFAVPDPVETRREKIDAIVAGTFEFNGEQHRLGDGFDWLSNPSTDVEWHILLHKFYYATGLALAHEATGDARYCARWIELTSSWMDAVPVGFIAADVTGRRVQNWIYAYRHFVCCAPAGSVPAAFHERLLASLDEQVEFLCANLTPKRNHRTLELYAIFLAGVAFPELARAAAWREFALAELVANAQVDLLPDGVHCELSTDYHHLVVKNYLCVRRLAALNGVAVPAAFDRRISLALDFAMHAHNPMGIVPAFSDGDARGFTDLLRQGHELYGREDWRYVATGGREGRAPVELARHWPNAGYCVLRSGWGEGRREYRDEHHLVLDCGPLGEGNHGHLDCLSFELAANGRSLVVDPGRYTYSEAGPVNWRVRFRGTAAHSTVTVDGRNQTRYEPKPVIAGTRHRAGSVRHRIAGPAPVARLHAIGARDGFRYACASARSAEYPAVHVRHVAFVFDAYWLVVDRLESPERHAYDARLQLGAEAEGRCTWESAGDTRVLRSPGLAVAYDARSSGALALDEGWVSADYGTKHAAPVLRATQGASAAWFHAVLVPHAGAAPDVRVAAHAFDGNALAVCVEGVAAAGERDVVVFGAPDAPAPDVMQWTGGIGFDGGLLAVRLDARRRPVALATIAGHPAGETP